MAKNGPGKWPVFHIWDFWGGKKSHCWACAACLQGTRKLCSKERRAADPAVKERAAVHAAGQEAAAREEILPSPEKLGSNTSLESLSGPDFFQRPLKIIIFCGGVRSPNPLRSVGWGT